MFSYDEKMKAIQLYMKYESWSSVIDELGYPSVGALRQWVQEYTTNGDVRKEISRKPKYSDQQIQRAVDYYLTHGRNIAKTVRDLGYPCRAFLQEWLKKYVPDLQYTCRKGKSLVHLTDEEKMKAVIELCAKEETATSVAARYGVDRMSLYNWKHSLLGYKEVLPMPKKKTNIKVSELQQEVHDLSQQADELRRQVYQLQLEKDVLEKAAEVIKKDQGITLQTLTNREKATVIDTLRGKYPLKELLSVFHMAKSSYCYQETMLKAPDKYENEREMIRKSFTESNQTYGYRRIYLDLKDDKITLSKKVIRRLMKEESLAVRSIKKKRYNSYMGEISPAVENIIKRDFHADKPNKKWLTDITEFHIPSGKIYLSPIIDCFDGLPVAWAIGVHPNAELVNSMLDQAISTLKMNEKPIVHSDRGAHYRWSGWIERMERAGLTRSMSKKGCSPDNSACEGFFGRLKNEMFYNRS
jgi:putative transposase